MRVVIAGGHGQIALLLEESLARGGDEPVGIVRNPAHVPDLEAVEAAVADKALVAKVNIDDLPDLTTRYNVKAVPTFIVFKAGKEISRFTGFKTRKDLLAALGAI